MSATTLGKRGEDLALSYLRKRGYTLLCRNYASDHHEIDLVMMDGDVIVFVEVKARSSVRFGTPAAFVTKRKQGYLILAAQSYLMEHGAFDLPARFDVVEIDLLTSKAHHIPNAFST